MGDAASGLTSSPLVQKAADAAATYYFPMATGAYKAYQGYQNGNMGSSIAGAYTGMAGGGGGGTGSSMPGSGGSSGGSGGGGSSVGSWFGGGGGGGNGGGGTGAIFGTGGGAAGSGFAAPAGVGIPQPNTVEDVQKAQGGVNNSLQSQQDLLNALQAQSGLQSQTHGLGIQQGLINNLEQANGVGTQQSAIKGLQGLAGQQAQTAQQYQDIAQGRGPNPAQAMLNQQTGQNVSNQAAMMAGQRGAGANVGLMARQAAQQGANTQQQAVGQGATMQANQQLGALSGLTAAQAAQGNTQQAIGSLGSNQVGAQQAANQAYLSQANQIAGQQIGQTSANAQANLANYGQQVGALQGATNANVSMQGNINSANSALANTSMQGQQKVMGGIMQGIGAAAGMAEGGEVKMMAEGGGITGYQAPPSYFGDFLKGWQNMSQPTGITMTPTAFSTAAPDDSWDKAGKKMGENFKSSNNSPDNSASDLKMESIQGEETAQSDQSGASTYRNAYFGNSGGGGGGSGGSTSYYNGNAMAEGGLAQSGGHVTPKSEAQKAVKKGDSYDNDKVPAMLSAGEIVLPRSVTQSGDPVRSSADFVAKVLAKRRAK